MPEKKTAPMRGTGAASDAFTAGAKNMPKPKPEFKAKASTMHIDTLRRMRIERDAEHLHALGKRALVEFLIEIGQAIGGLPCIEGRLAEYRARLTPAMIRAAGADRFPPRALREVRQ